MANPTSQKQHCQGRQTDAAAHAALAEASQVQAHWLCAGSGKGTDGPFRSTHGDFEVHAIEACLDCDSGLSWLRRRLRWMLQRCSWLRVRSRCRRWRPSMTRRWPDWQRTESESAVQTACMGPHMLAIDARPSRPPAFKPVWQRNSRSASARLPCRMAVLAMPVCTLALAEDLT